MKYICIEWLWYRLPKGKYNISFESPVKIYSEIDENRYETRKIEFFLNGKVGYVSDNLNYCEMIPGFTDLSDQPTPSFEFINADPEFVLNEIPKESFEKIWNIVVGSELLE
ncbi:hypothetical protein SD71_01785 [Cohnella kolymensis]|uniref:DUF6881 domain-containing protein n=1 Tax=Cohnella kolymensis TaxID=1590652 RepID=A0ABR5A8X4_9BACL|nr:hypothetical protein [Cohnella kolymensis]KIL37415.1 hypothetical protein SD71_01785 [Cohnella kolymensis]